MILKSWSRGHRVKLALLVAVPLGIYWVLAAQMSWRPRTLIDLGKHAQVWSLSLSPDGERLAFVSTGGLLHEAPHVSVWTRGGKLLWRNDLSASALCLRDGKTVMDSNDWTLELRDALTGRLRKTWELNDINPSVDITLSPDEKMLASYGDTTTWIYDLSRVTKGRPHVVHQFTEEQNVFFFAFSADSRTLATVHYPSDGSPKYCEIRLWDIRTWKLKRTFRNLKEETLISFSPKGEVLASVSLGGTKLWNPRSGKCLRSLATGNAIITFSPDGKVLASSSKRSIKLWDVRTGALFRELVGHRRDVNAIVFSSDGAALISASDDGTVRQWRIK